MICGVAVLLAGAAQANGQTSVPPSGNPAGNYSPLPIPTDTQDQKDGKRNLGLSSFDPPEERAHADALWKPLFGNLLSDQRALWTSPTQLRLGDLGWLLPLGGMTGALVATDQQFSSGLSNSPSRLKHFDDLSNYGAYAMVGGVGAMYLWGHLTHNTHLREAGFLGGEALLDSLAMTEGLKYTFARARPMEPGSGEFWKGGSSFPSEHSAAAWALAGVLAHEYPGPLTKMFAYGMASAISASRISAKQHFPSDVLVGSLIGYLVARHVYEAHHDPDLSGGAWRLFPHLKLSEERRQPGNRGSPYVPLDSWVYPAITRLAALGYVNTEFLGMRPWTRLECARLVEEASDHLRAQEKDPPVAGRLIRNLQAEFSDAFSVLGGGSNQTLEFESVYTRFTGIAGQPLTDGYHTGQTITNDFGRPDGEGFNNITGFTGWASSGPVTAYLQGEYQHAPAGPIIPLAARQFLGAKDGLPELPADLNPEVDRFRALNAYVAMNFENWQLSFGKQSLWWGPGEGGSMMLSDNAEPLLMLRLSRVTPFKLPSILGLLGPMRTEFFVGRLSGYEFIYHAPPVGLLGQWGEPLSDEPMIHGEKISFKPTPNLEFGFDRTTVFAGAGYPLTLGSFARSMFSFGNTGAGATSKPGDRRSGFDLTYRLPLLRNWVTFYTDSFTDDQLSPVAYFDRSANSAGLYFPHLPKLPKFDLRLEGVYTDTPIAGRNSYLCCGSFYFNDTWRSGYRNAGNLIGSWIGRDGQGEQAWLTYWQSPRSYVRFGYRHQEVSQQFLPNGGNVNDGSVEAAFWVGKDVSVSASLQYEKWSFPILRSGPTSLFMSSVQLTYWPRWQLR